MNSVILTGRLTRDPELRYTTGNQMAVAKFSIAVDRPVRQGKEREADFPRITVFGKQAENCERYLAKGRMVGIQGRLQTGSYQDKDGKTVYTTDVIADRVEFLEWGDRKEGASTGGQQSYGAPTGGQQSYSQPTGGQPNYSAPDNFDNSITPQGSASSSFDGGSNGFEAEMPDSFQTIDEDVPF